MTTLDLFDLTSQSNGSTASAVADAAAVGANANSDIPAPIIALEAAYRAEIALRMEVDQKVDRINAEMNGGGFTKFGQIDIAGRHGIAMSSCNFTAYGRRVEEYARHALSIEGAPFTASLDDVLVDGGDLYRRKYRGGNRCDDAVRAREQAEVVEFFSPIVLWREIHKAFDPEAQRRAANKECAHKIRSEFGMLHGRAPEMKVVKGRVEVVIRVWTRINFNSTRQLSYDSRLHELGDAIQQALLESGVDATFGHKFSNLCRQLHEHSNRVIVSRERVHLGDGVDVVLGYEAFKLYLPQEIANTVNMFLSEYPAEDY
ncbi:hypothetical protein VPH13_14120 [Stenotrophomonas pavanii]|uniref:hypothetical protein n=1 Tax=Stenotrophomonas pavanii TaxID=487698 RepID=UPI002DB94C05|nr:hypothetical protein [Stenotrophomonas pavanii]MEC4339858.1 hypothetical protein [Stenotrophomonas pavanii]